MQKLFDKQVRVVLLIGIITVATHPAFALLIGVFYTIY